MEFNSQNRASSGRPGVNPPTRSEAPQAPQAHMSITSHKKNDKKLSPKLVMGIVAGLVVLAVGWYFFTWVFDSARIDNGKYQAVFLSNGQVYFGKLEDSMGQYMYLKDVYYIQPKSGVESADNPQQTSESQTNVELVKLGNEVHGPTDQMTIRKEQVLFFENLKSDGQVAKTIAEDKN
ncbi:hypothetical protein B7Z17_01575 [Candidatus Saccharibacteria bacterium 32-49-10]|nr:MAG: hypothetical protein B7Z17_01575 [Candidatus Saccharibacteria bacterium 32-49-10]